MKSLLLGRSGGKVNKTEKTTDRENQIKRPLLSKHFVTVGRNWKVDPGSGMGRHLPPLVEGEGRDLLCI